MRVNSLWKKYRKTTENSDGKWETFTKARNQLMINRSELVKNNRVLGRQFKHEFIAQLR